MSPKYQNFTGSISKVGHNFTYAMESFLHFVAGHPMEGKGKKGKNSWMTNNTAYTSPAIKKEGNRSKS